MALEIDSTLTPVRLLPKIERLFSASAAKLQSLNRTWNPSHGSPVFTVRGRYVTRGWTEWTQGFQIGSALLQFDATGEKRFLELGRRGTVEQMARHVSHVGVHDHGFNNISTYGNLRRLLREGRIPFDPFEAAFYDLALKTSGAIQAARWTALPGGEGYIYSFNGPHSLFIDTLRSLRSLALAHQLGHVLMDERDQPVSLLQRLAAHAITTVTYNIYYGQGRDAYDVRGRTAHESIFNVKDGSYRCPNSQQGFSAFTTWTRGLAWAISGLAELLEFLESVRWVELNALALPVVPSGPRRRSPKTQKPQVPASARRVPSPERQTGQGRVLISRLLEAATATADFYLENCCQDGVALWDTGAPNRHRLGDYLSRPANPFNRWEPVDSSAATIAAQGLLRLGRYLRARGATAAGRRYWQAGLTIADTLLAEPYLSLDRRHQGLILHSVYHRPNGWDYVAPGQSVPNGESSMWGDYHARELGLLLLREAHQAPYLTFYDPAAVRPRSRG